MYTFSIISFDEGEMATAKRLYDLSCKFMYQEAKTLEQRRKEFFDHFQQRGVT